MDFKPGAEYITNDQKIRFRVIDGYTIHSEILRKQSVGMAFNDILQSRLHIRKLHDLIDSIIHKSALRKL